MHGRRAIVVAALGGAAIAAFACNALNGAGGLAIGDDADGAAPTTTSTPPPPAPPDDPDANPPPACTCVDAPPAGWAGPVALVEQSGTAATCPAGLVSILDAGADAGAKGTCTACTCGPTAATCATARANVFANQNCVNTCRASEPVKPTCGSFEVCTNVASLSAQADPPNVPPQTCPADGGALVPASWGRTAAACAFAAPPSDSCGGGLTCAPQSLGAVGAKTCIVHTGDVACPAGAYATKLTYATRIDDTRACAQCSCSGPTGTCTGGVVTVYGDPACMLKVVDVPVDACTNTSPAGNTLSAKLTVPPTFDGGCTPHGGGLAGGAIAEADPATICCLP